MPKVMSRFVLTEQPINWRRAFFSGALSSALMMSFIDTFYLLDLTPFSFEPYIGNLFLYGRMTPYSWTIGFFGNLITGGLFGFLYAYCFEYVYRQTRVKIGMKLGAWHCLFAAVAIFPFFNAIYSQLNLNTYREFGFLGLRMGAFTFILLLVGHLLFGACMGLFYGDVAIARVRTRFFEPGQRGSPGEAGVLTEDEDHPERIAV